MATPVFQYWMVGLNTGSLKEMRLQKAKKKQLNRLNMDFHKMQ